MKLKRKTAHHTVHSSHRPTRPDPTRQKQFGGVALGDVMWALNARRLSTVERQSQVVAWPTTFVLTSEKERE